MFTDKYLQVFPCSIPSLNQICGLQQTHIHIYRQVNIKEKYISFIMKPWEIVSLCISQAGALFYRSSFEVAM